ncbi:MAG: hypothetical protein M1393_05395 [Candidatus Thermoplasmatota archaeon]|nr:hypothetical protein [Candidatus Thermoplasmatota archaeon]MDA8144057.1 hypothetical protein [Thermoplasmatales archaeon]
MDTRIFMRSFEDQLKQIKFQLIEADEPSSYQYDINKDELLDNAKMWFLRTVQNTELLAADFKMSCTECISESALEIEKSPPYRPKYPALVWMILNLEREQVDTIFGVLFFEKLTRLAKTHRIITDIA